MADRARSLGPIHERELLTAAAGALRFHLSMIIGGLWLMPLIGWLLLFSAFARQLPLLWALGAYVLIGILEDIAFGTQYLANWTSGRAATDGYLLLGFSGIPDALFRYNLLIGVALSAVLLGGAALPGRTATGASPLPPRLPRPLPAPSSPAWAPGREDARAGTPRGGGSPPGMIGGDAGIWEGGRL